MRCVPRGLDSVKLGPQVSEMSGRYRHDPVHPARLNKQGHSEPTRQPRRGDRSYCLVWPDHDVFKIGLSSGQNARNVSAVRTISKYFEHEGVTGGRLGPLHRASGPRGRRRASPCDRCRCARLAGVPSRAGALLATLVRAPESLTATLQSFTLTPPFEACDCPD